MRTVPVGVAISTSVHVALLVYLATHGACDRDPPVVTETAIEIIDVTPPAIEVSLPPPSPPPPVEVARLDVPTPSPIAVPAAAKPRVPRDRPGAPPAAAAIIAPGRGSGAETAPGTEHPVHSGLMDMRREGAPKVNIDLPAGYRDDLDHVPAGTDAQKPIDTGQLDSAPNGHHISNQGPFSVDVDRDGNAHITDGPNLKVGSRLPTRKDIGDGLREWQRSGKPSLDQALQVSADPDARTPTAIVPILGGSFDATDALMRAHGQDPYASAKLKVLDSTRDERVQIGAVHRHEQLAGAAQLMQHNLAVLWATVKTVPAAKQALFELWDECVETGDPELVAAGKTARLAVIGFIRGHLGAGTESAYTAAELAAFNRARRSKAPFAPY